MKSILQIALLWIITSPGYAIHDYPADEYWLTFNDTRGEIIDHSAWQNILDQHLMTDAGTGINLLDYSSLQKKSLSNLNDYLGDMALVKITEYNRAEQFSFWVNLYNAITVKLITDSYPVKSIRKLGGWFSLGPWDDELITIEGIKLSLNDIEHRILRPIWQDYRIHFVVNCASLGCPNLHDEALTADNAEQILHSATKGFIRHPRGVTVAEGQITLSKIFDWYQSDFGNSEQEVLALLAEYLELDQATSLRGDIGKIRYAYDWSLNAAE